jgi:hypothetical protein
MQSRSENIEGVSEKAASAIGLHSLRWRAFDWWAFKPAKVVNVAFLRIPERFPDSFRRRIHSSRSESGPTSPDPEEESGNVERSEAV